MLPLTSKIFTNERGDYMKKKNLALIMGTIIILLLLFTVIFEDYLITADPYSLDKGIEYDMGDEILKIEHPVQPNIIDKLGTDPLGRNVLSLLIAGSKVTLGIAMLTAAMRMMIAFIFSIFTRNRISSKTIKNLSLLFNLIVEAIVGFYIFNRQSFKQLSLGQAIIAYSVVLALVGWARYAKSIRKAIDYIADENKTTIRIVREIIPNIVANYFLEVGRVLFILCLLGLLGICVGVNKYSSIETAWGVIPNYNPEWGGILATAKIAIAQKKYWLVVNPLICFIISILGFKLTGRGILNEIESDRTKLHSRFNKFRSYFSIRNYIEELESFSDNKMRVLVKSVLFILLIYLIISPEPKIDYKINGDRAVKDLEEFSQDKYEGRLTGTEGRDKACEYIAEELKKAQMLPIFDDKYIQEYDIDIKNGNGIKSSKGKNVGGYIWGISSNNPLIIVTNYDYLGYNSKEKNKGLYENGTSVAATLELARSLGEKSRKGVNDRTIVFLFTDGSKQNSEGVRNAIGSKNIDVKSLYIYLNYLGLKDSDKLYMDTSTVSSAYKHFYKNIRNMRKVAKQSNVLIEQEYFNPIFSDSLAFMDNKISGVVLSGVNKDDYYQKFYEKEQNEIEEIDFRKFKKQIQFVMDIVVKYAWSGRL